MWLEWTLLQDPLFVGTSGILFFHNVLIRRRALPPLGYNASLWSEIMSVPFDLHASNLNYYNATLINSVQLTIRFNNGGGMSRLTEMGYGLTLVNRCCKVAGK